MPYATAEQVMVFCKHVHWETAHVTLPNHEPEQAPDEINTYTDGGQLNPNNQRWSIASAGCWTETDSTDLNACINSTLVQFGRITQQPHNSISIDAALGGQQANSTRSEGYATIIGLSVPGPRHIGIDNSACLQSATQLLNLAKHTLTHAHENDAQVSKLQKAHCTGKLQLPWGLQPSGDIWRLMFRTMRAKGPHAIRLSKVFGHSTNDDIANGKTTFAKKYGNDRSDQSATRGYDQHSNGTHNLARYYAKRHHFYIVFVASLQNFIVQMMLAAADLRHARTIAKHPFSKRETTTETCAHSTIPQLRTRVKQQSITN